MKHKMKLLFQTLRDAEKQAVANLPEEAHPEVYVDLTCYACGRRAKYNAGRALNRAFGCKICGASFDEEKGWGEIERLRKQRDERKPKRDRRTVNR